MALDVTSRCSRAAVFRLVLHPDVRRLYQAYQLPLDVRSLLSLPNDYAFNLEEEVLRQGSLSRSTADTEQGHLELCGIEAAGRWEVRRAENDAFKELSQLMRNEAGDILSLEQQERALEHQIAVQQLKELESRREALQLKEDERARVLKQAEDLYVRMQAQRGQWERLAAEEMEWRARLVEHERNSFLLLQEKFARHQNELNLRQLQLENLRQLDEDKRRAVEQRQRLDEEHRQLLARLEFDAQERERLKEEERRMAEQARFAEEHRQKLAVLETEERHGLDELEIMDFALLWQQFLGGHAAAQQATLSRQWRQAQEE
eukprot:RCo051202